MTGRARASLAHAETVRRLRRAFVRLRAERGWTQEELADRAGLATRTVQHAESGRSVSLATLAALAGALGCDVALARRGKDDGR